MDPEIKSYLAALIDEDAEHNRDHLIWLASPEAADEEDRERQIAECQRAVELAALRELVAHCRADVVVALAVMAISLGESFEIRYRFDVPNDDACTHGGSLLTAVSESMPI